jgi:hypothetical protein
MFYSNFIWKDHVIPKSTREKKSTESIKIEQVAK